MSDTTSAALAGAKVSVRNLDTGFTRETTSGGDGFYRLLLIPVGRYALTVEAATLSRHEPHDALARLTVERAVEPALTLPAGTPLADAARRLLHHGAPEALVTEDERLVGILTHSDLLRALILKEPEAAA